MSRQSWGLKTPVTAKLYKGVFCPTITYAAAGWADKLIATNIRYIEGSQRNALLSVAAAYKTSSADSLCVIAGEPPIDLLLEKRVALYKAKKGQNIRFFDKEIPNDERTIENIEEAMINEWQSRWSSSEKGRTTYRFFKDIRTRLEAEWFKPNHYATQFLTGHGDFARRLKSLGLSGSGECLCGGEDTAMHQLLECPLNETLRQELFQKVGFDGNDAELNIFVSSQRDFELFTNYCKSILDRKQSEKNQPTSSSDGNISE